MSMSTFIDNLKLDLGYSVRSFKRSPIFTVVVVCSLALGIGANTAIFSLIDAVLLRILPVENPSSLVRLAWGAPGQASELFSYPMYRQLRDRAPGGAGVFAWEKTRLTIGEDGGEQTPAILVSGNYFSTLGVRSRLGRLIAPEDDREGDGAAVAVVSHAYWRQRFGGMSDVIGKSLRIEGVQCMIIGVMPPEFQGTDIGRPVAVAVPLNLSDRLNPTASKMKSADSAWLSIMARRSPNVSLKQAQAEVSSIWPNLLREVLPGNYSEKESREFLNQQIFLTNGSRGLSQLREQFSAPLWILMGVVVLVLLITCVNITNLFLARANARQQEMAVRMALGAGSRRLIQQTITESLLLSCLGSVPGIFLAYSGGQWLLNSLSIEGAPISIKLTPNLSVLGFTALTAVFTAVLCGLVPAWRVSRIEAGSVLAAGTRSVIGERSRWSVSKSLIVSQIAISVILMVCAGLFLRTFQNLTRLDTGFRQAGVLLIRIDPRRTGYREGQLAGYYQQIAERARSMPGAQSACLSSFTPISGDWWSSVISAEGYTPQPDDNQRVYFNNVGPRYFETLGTPILQGRDFGDQDRVDSQRVAIINESVARKFFPGVNPLGRHLGVDRDSDRKNLEVIGVVKDAKYETLREQRSHTVYVFYRQQLKRLRAMTLSIRPAPEIAGNPGSLVSAARAEITRINPEVMMTHQLLQDVVDRSIVQERLLAYLAGLFGLVSLILISIGVYGLMAQIVIRRIKEIGIRIALGATRGGILWMVMREVWLMSILGVFAGAPLALLTMSLLSKLLFGVNASDLTVFSLTATLLLAVATLAGWLPARRASRADPMTTLRQD